MTAVALAVAVTSFPFMLWTVLSAMEDLDPDLLPAAATMGSDPVEALICTRIPLLAQGIVTGPLGSLRWQRFRRTPPARQPAPRCGDTLADRGTLRPPRARGRTDANSVHSIESSEFDQACETCTRDL